MGTAVNASDAKYLDWGSDKFLNAKYSGILGLTNAKSLMNNMKQLDVGELPESGDLTNSGFHVNVVTGKDERSYSSDLKSSSGSLPPRVPTNSFLDKDSDFQEWNVIDEGSKKTINVDKLPIKPPAQIQTNNSIIQQ